jgi:hypothetical protein
MVSMPFRFVAAESVTLCGEVMTQHAAPLDLFIEGDHEYECPAQAAKQARQGPSSANPPLSLQVLLHPSRALLLGFTEDVPAVVQLLHAHGHVLAPPSARRKTWLTNPATCEGHEQAARDNGERARLLGVAFALALLPDGDSPAYVALQHRVLAAFRFGFAALYMLMLTLFFFVRGQEALPMEEKLPATSKLKQGAKDFSGHGIPSYHRILLPETGTAPVAAILEDPKLAVKLLNAEAGTPHSPLSAPMTSDLLALRSFLYTDRYR